VVDDREYRELLASTRWRAISARGVGIDTLPDENPQARQYGNGATRLGERDRHPRKVPATVAPKFIDRPQAIASINSGTAAGADIIPIDPGIRRPPQQVLSQVSSRLRLACATSEPNWTNTIQSQ
jgi:hypothetical protein